MKPSPDRILRTTAFLVCLPPAAAPPLLSQEFPRFELRLSGRCGETVPGRPGSHYDDGTGGADLFFDDDVFRRTFEEVPNDRPGHTWDVILETADNPTIGTVRTVDCAEPFASCDPADCDDAAVNCVFGPEGDLVRMTLPGDRGAQAWSWTLATEGALAITDVTTSGSRSCAVGRGPECLGIGGFEFTGLVGPPLLLPDGRTIERESDVFRFPGAASTVILAQRAPVTLPPEEEESIVAKIRVFGTFPAAFGDREGARLLWLNERPRAGGALVTFDGRTLNTFSNPPLVLTDCEVTLRSLIEGAMFSRGDADGDGSITVSDVVVHIRVVLGHLPARFACDDTLDVNDDGRADLSDAVRLLLYFFQSGEPPAEPFPGCGEDPSSGDALECLEPSAFCRDAG